MKIKELKNFLMVASLVCLPFVSSCVEDDPDNFSPAMLNKYTFSFGEEGGVDTLYATDNRSYKVWIASLEDTASYWSVYDAYMSKGDTAFVNDKNEVVGKVTYQKGRFHSLETEWYSVRKDDSTKDFRYILEAHPGQCPYNLSLYITLKNGASTVRLVRKR